jgi:hypothetical protein
MGILSHLRCYTCVLPGSYYNYHYQTDISFLDREIKQRKQAFGIEIYELMEMLETNDSLAVETKEAKIRSAFDAARKDIAVIQAKKDCKLEEIAVMEAEAGGSGSAPDFSGIPPSSGTVLTNEHPSAAAPPS